MKKFLLLFLLASLSTFSQSQLKITLNGLSAENKISLEDYNKNDSLLLIGANSADFIIVKGAIGIVINGTAKEITFNSAKSAVINATFLSEGPSKSFNLFYENIICKNKSTGKTMKLAPCKITIIKP